MQTTDRAAFAALLSDVMAFYRQDVSAFALSVWWQACERFDIEQVRKAMTGHAMDPEHGQFAPKPADIVRKLQGTYTDRSLVAWGRVLQAIERQGSYATVDFDDAATHQAITDLGGWVKLCQTTYDELPFVQKRFVEAHRAYERAPSLLADAPAQLQGQHAIANAAKGVSTSNVVSISGARMAALSAPNGGAA